MRAAYNVCLFDLHLSFFLQAFEEKRLPQLKSEHPTFRLSQLKQLLRKEWMKSPENPLNQQLLGK